MIRVEQCLGILLGGWLMLCAHSLTASAAPIQLSAGPQLFIDDYLIDSQSNLTRVVNHPQRLDHPVITGPEDKNFQPFVTVVQDPQTKRFRVWYGIPASAANNPSRVAYMESEDGEHWIRPHRVLDNPGGLEIRFGDSVIDDGPESPDLSQRFKLGWYCGGVTSPPTGGLMIAVSPDGLNWKPVTDKPPVLAHNHDINNIFHDRLRNRYLATVSITTPYAPLKKDLRMPYQAESTDLVHWSEPWQVLSHDEKDEGELQFYAMSAYLTRGPLVIGMAKVLRDELYADPGQTGRGGIGYTALTWTRDGKTWQRDRDAIMPRNPTPGTWDHAMTWADCQIMVGDEVYIYYGGYKQGHKDNRFTERQIGLARMPRDRYVAREATGEGSLRTPVVTVQGDRITVNAKVDGELRVRVLDESANPISGFDFADATPIHGDSVAHAVQWKQPLSSIHGKPVRLEFRLSKGTLYAFDVVPGAQ